MAGNHGNCCFMVIFENVLEYVFFQSLIPERTIYGTHTKNCCV